MSKQHASRTFQILSRSTSAEGQKHVCTMNLWRATSEGTPSIGCSITVIVFELFGGMIPWKRERLSQISKRGMNLVIQMLTWVRTNTVLLWCGGFYFKADMFIARIFEFQVSVDDVGERTYKRITISRNSRADMVGRFRMKWVDFNSLFVRFISAIQLEMLSFWRTTLNFSWSDNTFLTEQFSSGNRTTEVSRFFYNKAARKPSGKPNNGSKPAHGFPSSYLFVQYLKRTRHMFEARKSCVAGRSPLHVVLILEHFNAFHLHHTCLQRNNEH